MDESCMVGLTFDCKHQSAYRQNSNIPEHGTMSTTEEEHGVCRAGRHGAGVCGRKWSNQAQVKNTGIRARPAPGSPSGSRSP